MGMPVALYLRVSTEEQRERIRGAWARYTPPMSLTPIGGDWLQNLQNGGSNRARNPVLFGNFQ
jgi:hypothetical protein